MKLTLSKIQNITFENKDTFAGFIGNGVKVRVQRYLSGWEPNLKVVVGDCVVWHDCEPTKHEMEEFDEILMDALDAEQSRSHEKRDAHLKIAREHLMAHYA